MRLPQDCSLRRIIGVGLPFGLSYVPTKLARVSQFDQCGACEFWGVCDVIDVLP
jgi:hypothetical protein